MGELMAIAQQHRRIAITSPLGKDVLLLRGFDGTEAISQLFHFDLDLLSENDSIKFQDVVGKSVTLRVYDADGKERHWNGFVSRFSQGAQDRRLTAYRAQMVPWLWFLTRTADCRIFQNQKIVGTFRTQAQMMFDRAPVRAPASGPASTPTRIVPIESR